MDHQIYLEHGKPMIFGKDRNKGLMMRCNKMEVVTIGENGVTEEDLIVHNAQDSDDTNHYRLVRMELPEFPVAMGVIRAIEILGLRSGSVTTRYSMPRPRPRSRTWTTCCTAGMCLKVKVNSYARLVRKLMG